MNFFQASKKYVLPPFSDADNDAVVNVLDCKPFDENRDGILGRALNILTGGKHGQTTEQYRQEKIEHAKKLQQREKYNLELLQEKNKTIKEKLKTQQLMAEQQQLRYLQSMGPNPPTPSQMMYSAILSVPLPKQKGLQLGRPGYEIVYSPKLPKGYRWKKISKKEQKERTDSEAVEHKFTHPGEAVRFQQHMMQIYGYMPEIFQVINPANGTPFFVVVEPVGLRRIR